MTTISTLARRLARTMNGERPGMRVYLDADGQIVARVYGPERFGPREDWEYCFTAYQERGEKAAGRVHHWTWAEMQDHIDSVKLSKDPATIAEYTQIADELDAEMLKRQAAENYWDQVDEARCARGEPRFTFPVVVAAR